MGKTSSAVKYKYNSKNYKQFNVQIKPALFEEISEYCTAENISRSEFLKRAIEVLASGKTFTNKMTG